MLLAETARFDYVLDDLTCAVASGGAIDFMQYWDIVHNWASIARAVKAGGAQTESLKATETYYGCGSLFVPITRGMVPYLNAFLPTVQCKPEWKPTKDGKNLPVVVRQPACDLVSVGPSIQEDRAPAATTDAQAERDEIFLLLAMAVVESDWQTTTQGRGHNIGSVLVTPGYEPVFYARNAIRVMVNVTQHGEVRLIQNLLNFKGIDRTARGMTVYTTLEPCALCSGMMTLTQISRAVYLQKDPGFGGVREALGAIKYPFLYAQDTTEGPTQKQALESAHAAYLASGKTGITGLLLTAEARAVFVAARSAPMGYKIKVPANEKVVQSARDYFGKVKIEAPADEVMDRCPLTK
jgi:tRNA(adenine34) deaminase